MRFLPWIEGPDFLIIYALYTFFLILVAVLLCHKGEKDFMVQNLNEDEYFVLSSLNRYSGRAVIKYFTFKLLSKGYIKSLVPKEGSFESIHNKPTYELNGIERILYSQYETGLSLSKVIIDSQLDGELRMFYEGIKNQLVFKGLLEDSEDIRKKKKITTILKFLIIVPGVWRWIGGIISDRSSELLSIELLVVIPITIIVLSKLVGGGMSASGRASLKCYRDSYSRKYSSKKSSDFDLDFENNNGDDSDFMAYFLLFNYGNENFGQTDNSYIDHGNTFYNSCSSCSSSDGNDGGSSCSSCSSSGGNDGGSSCSSCSSGCGGCGGGSD